MYVIVTGKYEQVFRDALFARSRSKRKASAIGFFWRFEGRYKDSGRSNLDALLRLKAVSREWRRLDNLILL
jgi:hypothetical protein